MTTSTQTKSLKPLLFHARIILFADDESHDDVWMKKTEALLEKDPSIGSYIVDWKPAQTESDIGLASLHLSFYHKGHDDDHIAELERQKKEEALEDLWYEIIAEPIEE